MSYFLILFFSLLGLLVSIYMYVHLKTRRPMVCFLGGQCNDVLFSKHAWIWKISNPAIGICYFSFLSAYFLWGVTYPVPEVIHRLVWMTLVIACLFSVWLIYVRIFWLGKLCEWCYLVALCTFAVTILVSY